MHVARQLPPTHVNRAVPAEAPHQAIDRKGVRRSFIRNGRLDLENRHGIDPNRNEN
jgi:hypothetical protein